MLTKTKRTEFFKAILVFVFVFYDVFMFICVFCAWCPKRPKEGTKSSETYNVVGGES